MADFLARVKQYILSTPAFFKHLLVASSVAPVVKISSTISTECISSGIFPAKKALVRFLSLSAALKELNAAERLKNLSSAFYAGEIPKDMHSVLIVDDIFTTGATMEATGRCLKRAGVEKIYCFSLAIKSDI